jgi:signal transduction histidine kinase/CheY-like chemotaxis protein
MHEPTHNPLPLRTRTELLDYLQIAGATAVLLWGVLFALIGAWRCAVAEAAYLLVVVATYLYGRRRPSAHYRIVWLHVGAVLLLTSTITAMLGGLVASGGFIVWGIISPTAGLLFLGRRATLATAGVYAASCLLLGFLPLPALDVLPQGYVGALLAGNMVGSLALVLVTLLYLLRRLEEENRAREAAQVEALRAQKLDSLGTLAGGIAHDFNNILMAFIGNIALARGELPPGSPVQERLARAETALDQATHLTRQLLTFARGGVPVRQRVSLRRTLVEASQFVLHGGNVDVKVEIAPDLWAVEADAGQVGQLLQNLVLNGAQAMPTGGTVEVRATNLPGGTRLPRELVPGEPYVLIEVEDHGTGIPAEVLARIFDPYFTTRSTGSGLGLATAYAVARSHGGCIVPSTVLGEGTVFRVYLPATGESVPEAAPRERGQSGGAGRILIMDDESSVLEVLEGMLRSIGYDVDASSTGEEALARFDSARSRGRPYDAVILDLTVKGGMGGADAAKKLLERDGSARIVASSGYANAPVMAEFHRHGFRAVLRKPYAMEALDETLRKVLEG